MREILVPWDSQPQEAVEPTTSSLRNGLTSLFNPASGLVAVADVFPAYTNTTLVPRQSGIAALFAASNTSHVATSNVESLLGLTDGTIFMHLRFVDTTNRSGMLMGATNNGSAINRVIAQAFTDGNVYFDWGGASSGGGGRLFTSTNKTLAPRTLAFVAGGGRGREIWSDGRLIASGADATSRPVLNVSFNWGSPRPGATGWDADIFETYLGATWNRALSHAELSALRPEQAAEQLFAPRTQYIPTASGVLVPTLSLSTFAPGSLTATGWRPQVTTV